jgi:hypothetical protein
MNLKNTVGAANLNPFEHEPIHLKQHDSDRAFHFCTVPISRILQRDGSTKS